MNIKRFALAKFLLATLVFTIILWQIAVLAALPTYVTVTGSGTTSASAIFRHDPNSQIRVVSAITTSDLATSTLSLYSGTTSHYLTATNNTGDTSIQVESTNGITSTSLLYISTASSNFVVTVSGFTSPTNVTVATVGAPAKLGSEVEVLSAATALGVGAKTNNVYASEALYVGNYGRAVYLVQTGTSVSQINAASAHYDSQAQ